MFLIYSSYLNAKKQHSCREGEERNPSKNVTFDVLKRKRVEIMVSFESVLSIVSRLIFFDI